MMIVPPPEGFEAFWTGVEVFFVVCLALIALIIWRLVVLYRRERSWVPCPLCGTLTGPAKRG